MNPKFHRHPSFFCTFKLLQTSFRHATGCKFKKKNKKNNHWVYLVEVLLWLLHQIDSGAYSSMA